MYQIYDEEEQLNPSNTLYDCNLCQQLANHPVLTPCGHLYCWHCLCPYDYCSVCRYSFDQKELFSVFIQSNEMMEGQKIPPKPKPRYSKQIKNSNSLGSMGGTPLLRNQNNIQRQQMLAGYGLFPSLMINSMSSMPSENHQEFKYKKIVGNIEVFLLIIILLMFFLS